MCVGPDLNSGLCTIVYYNIDKKDKKMCLFKTHDEPRIAQNDIEVWKVLTTQGLSPFRGYQYHPGMNKPSGPKTIPVPAEQHMINAGYLHAFRNREKVEAYRKLLQMYKNPSKSFITHIPFSFQFILFSILFLLFFFY